MPHLALLIKADGNAEEQLLRLREQLADVTNLAGARVIYSRISNRALRIMDGRDIPELDGKAKAEWGAKSG